MKVKIFPSKASGEIMAPPSKSLSHRALICGALSGESMLYNVINGSLSQDIGATENCLMHLGANLCVRGETVKIGGFDPKKAKPEVSLDCGESGSTLRFLIPLCLLSGERITLVGAPRLFERPLTVYEDICREQGIEFIKTESSLTLCGRLKSGCYRVRGDISSQFITGLLFALPLLDGVSIIEIVGELESASYIDLTLSVLKDFGIKITRAGNRFIIYGNQTYQNTRFTVEGDYSNAAFLDVFNFIGGDVTVNRLSAESKQGDRVYKEMFSDIQS